MRGLTVFNSGHRKVADVEEKLNKFVQKQTKKSNGPIKRNMKNVEIKVKCRECGEILDNNDRFNWENTATSSLSITPVQALDAGVYSCSAENSIGQTRSPLTYNLEVTCKIHVFS